MKNKTKKAFLINAINDFTSASTALNKASGALSFAKESEIRKLVERIASDVTSIQKIMIVRMKELQDQ